MRIGGRTDANHGEVGWYLRKHCLVVQDTHDFGGGMSDYLVKTLAGTLLMVEVKDGSLPASRRRLTERQRDWQVAFGDCYVVATCEADIIELAKR